MPIFRLTVLLADSTSGRSRSMPLLRAAIEYKIRKKTTSITTRAAMCMTKALFIATVQVKFSLPELVHIINGFITLVLLRSLVIKPARL